MTNKQRKAMIEQWVTQINPKAILRAADARCGARYAVYVVPSPGEFGTRCTDYLPLEQLSRIRRAKRLLLISLTGQYPCTIHEPKFIRWFHLSPCRTSDSGKFFLRS